MEITIDTTHKNDALSRTEAVASIIFENATPSRKDIQKEIAKKLKNKEELTIIKTIKTEFGEGKARAYINAYGDKTVMEHLERKNLIEKHSGNEPAKAESEE